MMSRWNRPAAHAAVRLAAAALLLAAAPARASAGRYALAIGNNTGAPDEVELRYAESDAQRIGEALRTVGQFYPENVQVLAGATASDVRRVIASLDARIRSEAAPDAVLFIFYSGHADAQALQLGATRLPLDELRNLVARSSAAARVLVLDACRTGTLTRVKGAVIRETFALSLTSEPHPPEGLAIMTSSTAGEAAQEFDDLHASVFTHHLLSALLGAADRNADGRITLGEAFTYAAERTLVATAKTVAGPQHPTFRFELGGRGDLILTWPTASSASQGQLIFVAAGTFFVQNESAAGPMIAEIASQRPAAHLTLPAGRYFVTSRGSDWLSQLAVTLPAAGQTVVDPARMERIEYARVVRKGNVDRRSVLSLVVLAGARGQLLDLGTTGRVDVGARLDFRPVSVELRVGAGAANHHNDRLAVRTIETTSSFAAVHVFDLPHVSFGFGIEVGVAWLAQRFDSPDTAGRDSLAGILAPVVQIELPIQRRVVVRLDGAAPTYLLREAAMHAAPISGQLSFRLLAGVGISL